MPSAARTLCDFEPAVLESIAGLDGAVVVDTDGRLLTFGAILRIAPETLELVRSVQGARTLAALAASQHGPVLKVSEDGYLTMFLKGTPGLGIVTTKTRHQSPVRNYGLSPSCGRLSEQARSGRFRGLTGLGRVRDPPLALVRSSP